MKCKYHNYNDDMQYISGNEFVEVYECYECGCIAVLNVEIAEFVKWYKEAGE